MVVLGNSVVILANLMMILISNGHIVPCLCGHATYLCVLLGWTVYLCFCRRFTCVLADFIPVFWWTLYLCFGVLSTCVLVDFIPVLSWTLYVPVL
jgi:hypothetical protein